MKLILMETKMNVVRYVFWLYDLEAGNVTERIDNAGSKYSDGGPRMGRAMKGVTGASQHQPGLDAIDRAVSGSTGSRPELAPK